MAADAHAGWVGFLSKLGADEPAPPPPPPAAKASANVHVNVIAAPPPPPAAKARVNVTVVGAPQPAQASAKVNVAVVARPQRSGRSLFSASNVVRRAAFQNSPLRHARAHCGSARAPRPARFRRPLHGLTGLALVRRRGWLFSRFSWPTRCKTRTQTGCARLARSWR
jgi:hypothetical protein